VIHLILHWVFNGWDGLLFPNEWGWWGREASPGCHTGSLGPAKKLEPGSGRGRKDRELGEGDREGDCPCLW